ncbi:MAG: HAD family phosphatase [Verrucomicrobia bacterium]|nr:HAD family phosphatase [Verrucomicrobiota bacterium]
MEAVIFDLGNVLLPFNWGLAAERFALRTGRSLREVDDYIVTTPFLNDLTLGRIAKDEYFHVVAKDFEFDGSYEEFAVIWSDIFTTDDEMIALASRLKGRCRRYILSNTSAIHMDFIFARYPFMHTFDGYILSHEVGLLKPDRRIYEVTLQRFGLTASEAVFIDDILANVEGARAVGIHGIHHRNAQGTREELTKLGIAGI